MSYFENIKTFVRTYDLGSLSAAGRDLRVSAAVVSARVLKLEQHLDVRLFKRTTRKLIPTQQGELFYQKAITILDVVDDAENSILDIVGNPKGSIYFSAPLGIGRRIISPLLLEFGQAHPFVHLRFRLTDRVFDMIEDHIDLALFLGRPPDSNLRILPIADCPRVLCASPSYIKQYGHPQSGDELIGDKHQCLNLRFPGAKEYRWTLQTKDEGNKKFTVNGQYESDHSEILLDWAVAGHGIIMRPSFEVQHFINTGKLVRVCEQTPPLDVQLAFLYNHKLYQDIKVRKLMDFLKPRILEQLSSYHEKKS